MGGHHFISYSSVDAQDFAFQLYDELQGGQPPIPVWLDKRKLRPGQDWDAQVAEAIRTCDSLIFIMTRDSVEDESVCKDEWARALKYKKPVTTLLLHDDAERPFLLEKRQYINFTGAFEPALAQLRSHIRWLASPEGLLQAMKDRLADARRDSRRTKDPLKQARIQDDIAQLEKQIADEQRVVDDPRGAVARVVDRITIGLEDERKPLTPVGGVARCKFINPPPLAAPSYFQDRQFETEMIADFLKDDALRLITVVGRGGVGKTATVCRLLKAMESGQLPDEKGPLSVDGIVYLNATGSRRVNVLNLFADLCKLLPEETAHQLDALYKNPQISTEAKMQALLGAFPVGRTVVLLDNFEDVVDPETLNIRDTELDEALRALLNLPHHAVKVVLTTRIAPRDLALVQEGRQGRLNLDEGLPSPYAENILRARDADGKVGLKSAPDDLLAQARERTLGYPRALEALFGILSNDRDTSLSEILNDAAKLLPEDVVWKLVGEAFSRLDPSAQQVMQALAIYGRPVTTTAIDYILQPYILAINCAPILKRLVNMQFVHKEDRKYYLHQIDCAYVLSRIPRGDREDRSDIPNPLFTQIALQHRGADYFRQIWLAGESWKTIADLEPQLAEFDLRCSGEDYNIAAMVLFQIRVALYRWGHYQLLARLYEGLLEPLDDSALRANAMADLGKVYWKLGQLRKAILVLEQALKIAREVSDPALEDASLIHLGIIYDEMGQAARSIELYQRSLKIASSMGSLAESTLNNLGRTYGDIGQTARGIRYCCQSVYSAREAVNPDTEAIALNSIGYLLMDFGELHKTVHVCQTAIGKADAINCVQVQHHGRYRLALAHLLSGDLAAARDLAEAALTYNVPENEHYLKALLGLILLRQGDRNAAQRRFAETMAQTNLLLEFSPENHGAGEVKGLALSGLALCGEGTQISSAITAYKAARAINHDTGVWARVLRLFDALTQVDPAAVLAPVRELVFTWPIQPTPNLFRSPQFIEYIHAEADQDSVKPPISPPKEWVNVYFGHPNEPERRTQDFHRILQEDSLIDDSEFHDFVAKHRPQLGNLLIYHVGLLEVVSSDEKGRRMFFVTEETIGRLFAL